MPNFKKAVLFILAAVLCFMTGCAEPGQPQSTTKSTTADHKVQYEHTLLVYMCGSDLESKHGSATKNISEMLSADIPDDTCILIETGGCAKWRNYDISSTQLQYHSIKDGSLKLEESLPDSSMGQSKTLSDFLVWGMENYPAKNYSLIFWDHGGGFMNGVCFDDNHGRDGLTLAEISAAFSDARLPQKLDFIGFDACLMSTLETAITVSTYTDNMIASQDKEPNGGWDYSTLVSRIGKEDFYDAVMSSYAEKSPKKEYYTLSHTDLTKLDLILEDFDKLIDRMKSESTPRSVVSTFVNSPNFGSEQNCYYDLGTLFTEYNISNSLAEYVTCINGNYRKDATGLSVFFPLTDQSLLQKYYTCNPYEPYSEFLRNFFESSDSEKISFLKYAEQNDNMLSFTLSPDSVPYLAQVEYYLFSFKSDGPQEKVIALGNDNDAIITDNRVTIQFKGRWVEFGGHLLNCTIADEQNEYTIYHSEIKLNDEPAQLIFSYDKKTGTANIIGVSFESEGLSRIHELQKGDSIIGAVDDISSGSYERSYPEENKFSFKSDDRINIITLPDGYYQYTAFATDIYGNKYTAGTAVVKIESGNLSIVTITSDEIVYPN